MRHHYFFKLIPLMLIPGILPFNKVFSESIISPEYRKKQDFNYKKIQGIWADEASAIKFYPDYTWTQRYFKKKHVAIYKGKYALDDKGVYLREFGNGHWRSEADTSDRRYEYGRYMRITSDNRLAQFSGKAVNHFKHITRAEALNQLEKYFDTYYQRALWGEWRITKRQGIRYIQPLFNAQRQDRLMIRNHHFYLFDWQEDFADTGTNKIFVLELAQADIKVNEPGLKGRILNINLLAKKEQCIKGLLFMRPDGKLELLLSKPGEKRPDTWSYTGDYCHLVLEHIKENKLPYVEELIQPDIALLPIERRKKQREIFNRIYVNPEEHKDTDRDRDRDKRKNKDAYSRQDAGIWQNSGEVIKFFPDGYWISRHKEGSRKFIRMGQYVVTDQGLIRRFYGMENNADQRLIDQSLDDARFIYFDKPDRMESHQGDLTQGFRRVKDPKILKAYATYFQTPSLKMIQGAWDIAWVEDDARMKKIFNPYQAIRLIVAGQSMFLSQLETGRLKPKSAGLFIEVIHHEVKPQKEVANQAIHTIDVRLTRERDIHLLGKIEFMPSGKMEMRIVKSKDLLSRTYDKNHHPPSPPSLYIKLRPSIDEID